jgi:hypothetical protein
MKQDNSRVVVFAIVGICLAIILGVGYIVAGPKLAMNNSEPSAATTDSPSPTASAEPSKESYQGWQKFVFDPTKTAITYPPGWQIQTATANGVGQVSLIRQPTAQNVDAFSIALAPKALIPSSAVVEKRPITLNSGKSATLLFIRNANVVDENITDIVLTDGSYEVGQEVRDVTLGGVGSAPVFVSVNLLPPNAKSNPGRPLSAFDGEVYQQVLSSIKTIAENK